MDLNLNIDIETYCSTDLKEVGLYKYAEADDFQILLFGYKLGPAEIKVVDLASGEKIPRNVIDMLYEEDVIKTAYNASFEFVCINRYLRDNGLPEMDLSQWEDTMFLSAFAGYGGSLKNTAQMMELAEDAQKDANGTRLINKFSKPHKVAKKDMHNTELNWLNGVDAQYKPSYDPEAWAQFIEYNRQDVKVESEIRKKLENIEIPPKEREAFLLDFKIMASGVLTDKELIDSAINLDRVEKERLTNSIKDLSGIDNPRSNQQVTEYLSKILGREVKSVKKELVPSLIKECESTGHKMAAQVLRLRSELSKTSLAKYYSLDRMACSDNRIRGMLQFYGSRTGRWAGRGVQVQNLPRNYLPGLNGAREFLKERNYDGLRLLYGENLSDTASQLIRTVFIPSPGKAFAVADYSAIEARVIAWLSGETWRLEAFRKNQDIYCVSASQMFNIPVEKILDKKRPEHALRAQGKVAELALGFQGGVNAIARMDFNNAIPAEDRQDIVWSWRGSSPKIVDLWRKNEEAAKKAIKNPDEEFEVNGKLKFLYQKQDKTLKVTLPSGRPLYYRNAKKESGKIGDGVFSFKGLNQITRKIEKVHMYGGRITENVVQAIARDCLSEALLRLDKAGYKIKFHVHDEVILEVDQNNAQEYLDKAIEIMCEETEWNEGLPLAAAGFIGSFYQKD